MLSKDQVVCGFVDAVLSLNLKEFEGESREAMIMDLNEHTAEDEEGRSVVMAIAQHFFDMGVSSVKPCTTGLTEDGDFILDAANAGELAAHDDATNGILAAVEAILSGKDDGSGVANEPWESIRRGILSLVSVSRQINNAASQKHDSV